MTGEIAVIAVRASLARAAALSIAQRLPEASLAPASLDGYLARPNAPRRVVLCAAPADREHEFLRRATARLLWPAPPADFLDAIAGLRTDGPAHPASRRSRRSPAAAGLSAALLLEGPVDATRASAALRSSATRNWIVESVHHVRLTARRLVALERVGVRWSALEPVDLVAVFAPRARARGCRNAILPARAPVWTAGQAARSRGPGSVLPRFRPKAPAGAGSRRG